MIGVESMELSFNEYLSKTLIWPVIYSIFAVFLLVLLYLSITKRITIFNVKYKIFIYVLLLLVSFGLFYDSIPTIKHGMFLFVENESNAVYTSGVITYIEEAFNSPRYYYEGNNGIEAKIITINDEQCYIFYLSNFEIGDMVTIEYLPKSTFVLSINLT